MSTDRERFEDIISCKKIKRESSDGHQIIGGRPAGTLNTATPCAACKLLRRRCAHDCPFSPYFSPHEPHKFASVHKVFGASNVSKMLMEVPQNQRADAANSLVYEANLRLRDPVYGCMGAISELQQQLQFLQAELNAVTAEIFRHRLYTQMLQVQAHVSSSSEAIPSPPPPAPTSSSLYNTVTSAGDFSVNTSNQNDNINYFG